ncbi:MAG: hypothetical protein KAT05_13450 [Spirochaetes bacterium]|nr:hypothetical protein [Spirochaetota bacterium]
MVKQKGIIKKMKSSQKITTVRSEDFKETTQDRISFGLREGYFIYVVQNQKFDTEGKDTFVYVDEVQVKMSPQQAIKTHEVLGRLIKEYERVFGEIKTVEKIESENPNLVDES